MSKYQQHVAKWQDCQLCKLCVNRTNIVLGKGKIPCDALFVGEAPGASEDILSVPFVGPAGKLLDEIIRQSGAEKYRLAFTNLVACIPLDDSGEDKLVAPPLESIRACKDRLVEFVQLANPKMIVCVGALAAKWCPEFLNKKLVYVNIVHPAAILRGNLAQRGLSIQRAVVILSTAIEDHLEKNGDRPNQTTATSS